MPCRSDGFDEPSNLVSLAKHTELKVELNTVTRLLCAVMQRCDDFAHEAAFDPLAPRNEINGLNEWWSKHQELDRKRKETLRREVQQKYDRFLQSLTDEERKALAEELN